MSAGRRTALFCTQWCGDDYVMNVTFQGTTYQVEDEPELLALIVTLTSVRNEAVRLRDRFVALPPLPRAVSSRLRRRRSHLKEQ